MYYIGIDLGTSGVKLLLMEDGGRIERIVSREYPIAFPRPGWSEQNPEDWWGACVSGLKELLSGIDAQQVASIGIGGQMHGLVVLDDRDYVLRPAILWNDARASEEVRYLNESIGRTALRRYTGNIAFAGFTAPKLLWMRTHEPELFSRIAMIMLPKDYIVYRLTGAHTTDVSDASGTLLFDVAHRCWSQEMLEICEIQAWQLAKVYESYQPVGTLLPSVAAQLGLPRSVRVAAGAGDNAAAAVGTGTIGPGRCNISLGTSGTIFISENSFTADMTDSLHSFAHADGGHHLMGCILSAASCNKWWEEQIVGTSNYVVEQSAVLTERLGKNHVFFLPYLMGERSPINDVYARATFIGMTMDTTRADMTQAVLEGVAFAMRDCLEVAKTLGVQIACSTICGGGAKSLLWKKILANVLNIRLDTMKTEQGPGFGSAILAAVAYGAFRDVQTAVNALVSFEDSIEPDASLAERYEERYHRFRNIYPACKGLFQSLV